MSFNATFKELRERTRAKLDAPCDNPKDQATHDRLAAYDNLHQNEGHTLHCAARQVYGQEQCTCHKGEATA